jgi:hypothetical protein
VIPVKEQEKRRDSRRLKLKLEEEAIQESPPQPKTPKVPETPSSPAPREKSRRQRLMPEYLRNKEQKTPPVKSEKIEKAKKAPEVPETPIPEKRRRSGVKNKQRGGEEEEEAVVEPMVEVLPERKRRKTIEPTTPLLKPSRLRLPVESPSKQTPDKANNKVRLFFIIISSVIML